MIECPSCKHQEFVGTMYCTECGTRLVLISTAPTMSISRDQMHAEALATKPAVPEGPELESGAVIGLRVVSTGDVVPLVGRDNYTVGRTIEGQAVVPDIDLGPFDAYDHGVSRMHAEIRLAPDGVTILDLESANGTLVNGVRADPMAPVVLRHGDVIQIGRLRLQLITRARG
jgi:pSer/pThr/pTyr-binding forkhead associated (FHA) protein